MLIYFRHINVAIIIIFLAISIFFQFSEGFIRTNRCYSCMSAVYETLFRDGHLSKYFYEPKNFTAQCDDPFDPYGIGFVPCRSICLTLIQDFVVMGRKTGRTLTMRGCSTTMNRYGFVNRTIAMFDRYDMCNEVKVSDLFKYETDSQPVLVCSCLGDKCNGSSSGVKVQEKFYITVFFILLLIIFKIR